MPQPYRLPWPVTGIALLYFFMDCIDIAQDRDQWKALVNTVMNLWYKDRTFSGQMSDCKSHKVSPPSSSYAYVNIVIWKGSRCVACCGSLGEAALP
jgi:hypothetical protein